MFNTFEKTRKNIVDAGLPATHMETEEIYVPDSIATVRPKRIDDVLVNPGMGFTTFQCFNGDELNAGTKWTEGYPIEYQGDRTELERMDYPMTSIAYYRIYWRFMEPNEGEYNWQLIDFALEKARERGQSLMLRIAPYGTHPENDVPDWYRAMVGPETHWNGPHWNYDSCYWMVDGNDPRYAQCFGRFIRELGKRYDGHVDLDSVDLSIVGSWGEGIDSERLTQRARVELCDAYLDTFTNTPLMSLFVGPKTSAYPLSKRNVGWRADCLGDMGCWEHMLHHYPIGIAESDIGDAWKKAPISFEACWVMQHWYNMGWDVDYIIEQSLKWHISSFNNKSSIVPPPWWPKTVDWLKKMGYRLAIRRLEFSDKIVKGEPIKMLSWWENLGVAPCYKNYHIAYRLHNDQSDYMAIDDLDLLSILPGDKVHKTHLQLPGDVQPGHYELQVAIVDKPGYNPRVKLAMEGLREDGWYSLAPIEVLEG